MAVGASSAGPHVGSGLANKLKRMVLVLVYFAVGSLFYSITEGWAPLDSCYFLIVCAFLGTPFTPGTLVCLSFRVSACAAYSWLGRTSTTVGFGDICPESAAGKLFTCAYALVGMTLIVSSLSPLVDALSLCVQPRHRPLRARTSPHAPLPRCALTQCTPFHTRDHVPCDHACAARSTSSRTS